tara:strand:+ start:332 stop:586 length:255 start_codon:yes stop_codon:yes gene_type:complete
MAKIKTEEREVELPDNSTIDVACGELGVPMGCRAGVCGACKIDIVEGKENLSELTDEERTLDMNENLRLACQCSIKSGEVKIKH